MKYKVDLEFPYKAGYHYSSQVFTDKSRALAHMEINKEHSPTLRELREINDYQEYYWTDLFGYMINKQYSSSASGSTIIMSGEEILIKLKLPELLVIATDKAVYLFDPDKQTWYD